MKEEKSENNLIYYNKSEILNELKNKGKYEQDSTLIIKWEDDIIKNNDKYAIKITSKNDKDDKLIDSKNLLSGLTNEILLSPLNKDSDKFKQDQKQEEPKSSPEKINEEKTSEKIIESSDIKEEKKIELIKSDIPSQTQEKNNE